MSVSISRLDKLICTHEILNKFLKIYIPAILTIINAIKAYCIEKKEKRKILFFVSFSVRNTGTEDVITSMYDSQLFRLNLCFH